MSRAGTSWARRVAATTRAFTGGGALSYPVRTDMRRLAVSSAVLALLALAACGKSAPSPAPSPSASTAAVHTPTAAPPPAAHGGWEEGPAALDRALAAQAPVLLYVGSEWCPPCKALEANLFSKQAFWEATKGFRRVRVDGDADGAQAVADRFEARAYPTLLLLAPGGEELFRAHHAVSLDELSPALAAAAATGSGFTKALTRLGAGGATAADCALLAAVDWSPASGMTLSTDRRLAALTRAFEQCREAPPATRAPLAAHLLGLAATADTSADSALPGAPVKPMEGALLDAVFQTDETAWAARTLVTTWAKPVVSWVLGADRGPRFAALRDRWLRAAAALRARPGAPLDIQLLGYNPVLDFHELEHADSPLGAPLRAEIEAAVARVDGLARSPAERHAVVPGAAYLLRSVGQGEKARALLLAEVARTDAPSYHLTTLSQWALADGHPDEARRFAREAVTRARGRPSRLQWMLNELSLYSNDPADRPTLLARAAEAYALLFAGDDAFLGRNQPRAARLAELLAPLSADPAVKALVEKYSPRCAALPEATRAPCREHFAALRAAPK